MTIKSTADGDEAATETMADRLRGVQLEPWKKIDFADEERDDSWATYQRSLLLQTDDGQEATTAGKGEKGKQVEKKSEEEEGETPEQGREGDAGAPELSERVHGLGTDWGEDELLRAVSGIAADERKPGEEAVTERPDKSSSGSGKGRGAAAALKREGGAAVKAEAGKSPRKGAASGRGGRTRGTAMEID
jgi:DNA-directed RNA polymerase-3 subunit RPC5